jgi:hypothetical protein
MPAFVEKSLSVHAFVTPQGLLPGSSAVRVQPGRQVLDDLQDQVPLTSMPYGGVTIVDLEGLRSYGD